MTVELPIEVSLTFGNSGVAVGPDGVTATLTAMFPAKPFKIA